MNESAAFEPVPVRELASWAWVPALLLLIAYLAVFDQGEVSRMGNLLHEFTHDGRHLLAAPCH